VSGQAWWNQYSLQYWNLWARPITIWDRCWF